MVEISANAGGSAGLESWIDAARRGDRDALGRALVSFREYLLLVANESLHPALGAKVGASDVVQDAFCLAHRGFSEFRGRSEAEWRSWLRTILLRSLSHQRRRYEWTAKRRPAREIPMGSDGLAVPRSREPSPSQELSRIEREAALMGAIDRLPPRYREVVLWHHRDKVAFEAIGERLGVSAEAARKLWTRALGRLSRELGPNHGPP